MRVRKLWMVALSTAALMVALFAFSATAFATHTLKTISSGSIDLIGLTWNKGTVTWSLEVSGGAPAGSEAAVRSALADVAHATSDASAGLFVLSEVAPGSADITIKVLGGGGRIAGSAQWSGTGDFFNSVNIKISGKSFGRANVPDVIKSIAIHEVQHGLGLGHASTPEDVMYFQVQEPPVTQVSNLDVLGWQAVMAWLINGTAPAAPTQSSVSVGGGGGGGGLTGTLDVTATVDPGPYVNRDSVTITISVAQGGTAIAGASVHTVLHTASGVTLLADGTTNSSGQATFKYKVNSKRDGTGTYTVDASASKDSASGSCTACATFVVN